jgi:hypothetical protein
LSFFKNKTQNGCHYFEFEFLNLIDDKVQVVTFEDVCRGTGKEAAPFRVRYTVFGLLVCCVRAGTSFFFV